MTRLTILHTNDIHGRVEQLARISTLAKQIQSEAAKEGRYTALWDAGDVEDPTLFESQVTKGTAAMALLRAAGYELATLGNASPVRYGQQVVPSLAARFGKPLLCANMFDPATGRLVPGLAAYSIQTFGSLKVAVIGFTAPMSLYAVFQVHMGDPIELLPGIVQEVRDRGAQLVVLLSHLGYDHNAQSDHKVAEQVAGIDLIIGGHTHTELDAPVVVNGTMIVQTGDYGRFLGRLDVEVDDSGRVLDRQGELIPVTEDIALDPQVMAAYAAEQASVRQALGRVVGELKDPLGWAEDGECPAGNLFADALLDRWKGAQIALTVAGHWRAGLEAGPLTVGALIDALRSTANPARVELTGAQIIEFLDQALKPENSGRKIRPLRGVSIGMPHVAGMTVRYDPDSRRVLEARVGGAPLEAGRNYVVTTTDLELSDYVGYLPVPEDRIQYEVPIIMPEVVEAYITRHSPMHAPQGGRVVPASAFTGNAGGVGSKEQSTRPG